MAYPTINIEVKGYDWHIKCYEINEREGEEFGEATKAQDNERLLKVLAGLIVEWDCTDRDGNPLPKTVEGLKHLPQSAMSALITGVAGGEVGLDPKAETSS